MYETLLRPMDVSHVPVLQPIGEVSEKLKQAERKREEKRLKQIAAGRQSMSKRKREDDGTPAKDQEELEETAEESAGGSKRIKTDDEDNASLDAEPQPAMDIDPREEAGAAPAAPPGPSPSPISPQKISVSKVMSEVRGHTSYLTFASLQPFEPLAETEPSTAAITPAPEPED